MYLLKQLIPDIIVTAFPHGTYVVGGAVRDALLNRMPKDIDFTTKLKIPEIKAVCDEYNIHYYDAGGEMYGTIIISVDCIHYEISTFKKNRCRKNEVQMGTMEDDIFRRDFTINAILYDIHTNKIIDMVDGITDLKNGILRTVGKPKQRIEEDPVRILRAIRFKNQYNLTYDKKLNTILNKTRYIKKKLRKVSKERIYSELLSLTTKVNITILFTELENRKFVEYLFPIYTNIDKDKYNMSIQMAQNLQNTKEFWQLVWTGLFWCIDDVDVVYKFLTGLSCSKKDIVYITTLLKNKMAFWEKMTNGEVMELQYKLSKKNIDICDLYKLYVEHYTVINGAMEGMNVYIFYHLKKMDVNGHDFIDHITHPRHLGVVLDEVRKYYFDHAQKPLKDELLGVGINIMKKYGWLKKYVN